MPKRKLSKRLEKKAALYKLINHKKYDEPSEWTDRAHRAVVAEEELQAPAKKRTNALASDFDGPVLAAFDAFTLSPANPRHWRILLNIFAAEHFRPPPAKNNPDSHPSGPSSNWLSSPTTSTNLRRYWGAAKKNGPAIR